MLLCMTAVYVSYFYAPPTCFDGSKNGDEAGVDCGGSCSRICAFAVTPPVVEWARSFRVTEGVYNAVGYIENRNQLAASPEVTYRFTLYDAQGLIAERTGTTILPPNSSYPVFEARIATGDRVPVQTFLEIDTPTLWLPAQGAVGQFTITNRELTGVDTRPRLTTTIYNNDLNEAEQVEVVATIFDRDGNALNASRTFIEQLAGRSQTDVVFTWPEPIAKTLKSCEVPTDVVVAIDLSGSMNNDQAAPPEPITSVLAAAEAFVRRLQPADQVSVVTFATEATVAVPLTSNKALVTQTLAALTIDPQEETGATNTGASLAAALQELTSARVNPDARKVVVLLTDGLATAPDPDPEQFAREASEVIRALGVNLYTIGLGEAVNMAFIEELATTPEFAYQALDRSEVNQIYQTITGAICEEGPAVIQIVPKSNALFETL